MKFIHVFIVILLLDQLSKQWLLFSFLRPWWILDGQVGFEVVLNTGIAFSLPLSNLMSFVLASLLCVGIFWYYRKATKDTLIARISFAMVLAGAVGNLIDRVLYGGVIDFIKVFSFPSFNIADSSICVGFTLMILFSKRIFLEKS